MQDDPRETIRRFAALSGLSLPQERIDALALILPVVQAGVAALAAVGYGETEPANRFHVRPEERP